MRPVASVAQAVDVARGLYYERLIERALQDPCLVSVCNRLRIAPPHLARAALREVPPERLRRLARTLGLLRRLKPELNCLRRALITGMLLRPFQPQLCIGIAPGSAGLAHAWISVGSIELGRSECAGAVPLRPARCGR